MNVLAACTRVLALFISFCPVNSRILACCILVIGEYNITYSSGTKHAAQEKKTMTGAIGLLIVAVVGGIVVTLFFVQDMMGSLKFWRAR